MKTNLEGIVKMSVVQYKFWGQRCMSTCADNGGTWLLISCLPRRVLCSTEPQEKKQRRGKNTKKNNDTSVFWGRAGVPNFRNNILTFFSVYVHSKNVICLSSKKIIQKKHHHQRHDHHHHELLLCESYEEEHQMLFCCKYVLRTITKTEHASPNHFMCKYSPWKHGQRVVIHCSPFLKRESAGQREKARERREKPLLFVSFLWFDFDELCVLYTFCVLPLKLCVWQETRLDLEKTSWDSGVRSSETASIWA